MKLSHRVYARPGEVVCAVHAWADGNRPVMVEAYNRAGVRISGHLTHSSGIGVPVYGEAHRIDIYGEAHRVDLYGATEAVIFFTGPIGERSHHIKGLDL